MPCARMCSSTARAASACAAGEATLRVRARMRCPFLMSCRATAPPWVPVAPVTSMSSGLAMRPPGMNLTSRCLTSRNGFGTGASTPMVSKQRIRRGGNAHFPIRRNDMKTMQIDRFGGPEVLHVAEKPEKLSWELAASLAVAGETATRVLDALAVQRGEMLLVHGGSGVVGSVAVQLARLRGARVIATGSAANQALLASLGATPVVYGDGLVARVRALGAPVDAVFDAAGKGALPDSIELRGGKTRIVTIADPSAHQLGIPFSAGTAAMRNVAVLRTMAELAASGKVTVAVAEVLPLAEAPRAHALIEKSHAPGKIVLTV